MWVLQEAPKRIPKTPAGMLTVANMLTIGWTKSNKLDLHKLNVLIESEQNSVIFEIVKIFCTIQ